jgi:hypothetical protein
MNASIWPIVGETRIATSSSAAAAQAIQSFCLKGTLRLCRDGEERGDGMAVFALKEFPYLWPVVEMAVDGPQHVRHRGLQG